MPTFSASQHFGQETHCACIRLSVISIVSVLVLTSNSSGSFEHFFEKKEHFQMIYAHSVDRRNHNALHLPDMYSVMYRGQRLMFREQLWDNPKGLTDSLPRKEQTGA